MKATLAIQGEQELSLTGAPSPDAHFWGVSDRGPVLGTPRGLDPISPVRRFKNPGVLAAVAWLQRVQLHMELISGKC